MVKVGIKRHKFLDAPKAFVKELRSKRRDESQGCWACGSKDRTMSINVKNDLRSLGIDDWGVEHFFSFCIYCSAAYMTSFNKKLFKMQEEENG